MTLVLAHRGASQAEHQNTIAAFARAVAMGADGVELDVRRTADDRLVVHHDPVLADGRPLCEIPSTELPAAICELDAALDACDGVFVNIEIKNDPGEPDFDPSDWSASAVASRLARRGGGPRWLLSSFRLATVDRVRSVLPDARTAWLVAVADEASIATTVAHGHDAIHPWVEALDDAAVRAAHRAGLAVNTWSCNDPRRIAELIAWGVDGICTDVPDLALDVRRSVLGST
jgi:glycerophosphoryl diester phosphodiesterase